MGECLIPIYRKDGSIVAHVRVDAEDFAVLSRYRWSLTKGYAVRRDWSDGRPRTLRMHRVILGLASGDRRQGDHWDRDRLNNTRRNLRITTPNGNAQNRGARGGTSRFWGVSWSKSANKWVAAVRLRGERYYLGVFVDEREAAYPVESWRQQHKPETIVDPALG